MILEEQSKHGISRFLVDPRLQGEPLHLHISSVEAGARSHPAHQHDGVEAIYLLEGEATLELENELVVLRTGEGTVFDPTRMHGLFNSGKTRNRYMVVLRH